MNAYRQIFAITTALPVVSSVLYCLYQMREETQTFMGTLNWVDVLGLGVPFVLTSSFVMVRARPRLLAWTKGPHPYVGSYFAVFLHLCAAILFLAPVGAVYSFVGGGDTLGMAFAFLIYGGAFLIITAWPGLLIGGFANGCAFRYLSQRRDYL